MRQTIMLMWAALTLVLMSTAVIISICYPLSKARATDFSWPRSSWEPAYSKSGHRIRVHNKKRRAQSSYERVRERERINAYRNTEYALSTDDEPDWKPVGECAYKIRGLGTQWIGEEGALDAAKKDWMEKVRYDLGESFLDLKNARAFVHRCGRVSIGETLGQVFYRCEMVARPCQGVMSQTLNEVKK
jgi:hypothetical protein